MDRKKLPIGIQTFRQIREDDWYYVDKTGYAAQMVAEGKTYFLSRPRRFGKSLFLDTLAEMFAGNKTLFEGLACYDTWDWDTVYPVVRISFADGVVADRAGLDLRVDEILADNADRLGVTLGAGSVAWRFTTLIRGAEARYGQRVVVLVDEYDKPILDNLADRDVARQIRDGLRDLYSVVKGQDAHIKFVLLTGVSKFSKVNIFSGLNNLLDITLSSRYSAVCGYTDHDVDTVFAPELEGLDRDQVRNWYNGYNWTGTAVYNPYDLLLLFSEHQFRNHWFETGSATFLVDMLMQRRFYLPDLARSYASSDLLSQFDVDDLATEALLFQSGYLTITGTQMVGDETFYILGFPNREVRGALNTLLLSALTDASTASNRRRQLALTLGAGDVSGLRQFFESLFAGIPHQWHTKNDIAHYEGYWSSLFYACFAATGLDVAPEESTNRGRLDLAVRMPDRVWLFELKVAERTPEGSALAQIKDRGYADQYRDRRVPIHMVGIELSEKTRQIVGFDTETIAG